MSDSQVVSPCICICALDENDVCVGCYRTAQEITAWSSVDNRERQAIVERAAQRARVNNPFA